MCQLMNKSTIYVKKGDRTFKILHIDVKKDDSVHVYFPRTEGYFVKSKLDIDLEGRKSKEITFESNIKERLYSPYFSYHPGKAVIHFNALDKNKNKVPLVTDRKSTSIQEIIKNQEFIPLITVVIPYRMDYFDEVNVLRKHNLVLNMPSKPLSLSMDILIHGKGGYIDKADLTMVRQRNIAFMCQLNDTLTNNLSYTLVFNNVECQSEEVSPELIAIAWNKEVPIGICLNSAK